MNRVSWGICYGCRINALQGSARIGGDEIVLNDMAYLRTHCEFLVLMPQWHFLNFLATQESRFPTFHLQMQTEAKTLIEENGRVAGIRAVAADGPVEIRADLVVSADGRSSVLRGRADLVVDEMGTDIDLLWMRLSKHLDDPDFWIHAPFAGRICDWSSAIPFCKRNQFSQDQPARRCLYERLKSVKCALAPHRAHSDNPEDERSDEFRRRSP